MVATNQKYVYGNNLQPGSIITVRHTAPKTQGHLIRVSASHVFYGMVSNVTQYEQFYNTSLTFTVLNVPQRIVIYVEAAHVEEVLVQVAVNQGDFNVNGANQPTFHLSFTGDDLNGSSKIIVAG